MEGFRVTVEAVKAKMERGEPVFLIDARNSKDWESTDTKVRGALRIPAGEEDKHLAEIPRDCTIVTY